MNYSCQCPRCRRAWEVSAAQAGTYLQCSCGGSFPVPRLSQLRVRAGQGAYESGIVGTIARMIAGGELPGGDLCAVSMRPTKDTLTVRLEPERSATVERTGAPGPLDLLRHLVGGLGMGLVFGSSEREVERMGRDTVVELPLRIDSEYHAQLARAGQRQLRKSLTSMPVYAELLRAYPRAHYGGAS